MARELANSFNGDENEMEAFKRFLFNKKTDPTTTTAKTTTSKYDAEELREINLKTESRRIKAFKNYEESCNIRGKFKVRSCPKLEDCYAKNKLKFVPLASAVNTTAKPPLTTTSNKIQPTIKPASGSGIKSLMYPHFERKFLERALASRFLRTIEDNNDEEEEKPFTDKETPEYDDVLKRFLLGTKTTTTTTAKTTTIAISKELAEETKERRGKAFKKYEEYCEKRKFRFGATRNCPQLDDKLC